MNHARAWVTIRHPGREDAKGKVVPVVTHEAGKVVFWIPDDSGVRVPRTRSEDIFGVFDIAVYPHDEPIELIQVTTIGLSGELSAVRARQEKVRSWIMGSFGRTPPPWLGEIYVIGWVHGKHFRIWEWQWVQTDRTHFGRFDEREPERAPIPKSTGKTRGQAPAAAAQSLRRLEKRKSGPVF